jgi:uncharacterized protein YbjT (DUF2867 family)
MTSPILVSGGTGTLGRLVIRRLRDAGRNVRVLSRRSHESEDGIEFMTGDLATGEGIEAAVDGVAAIVHLAGSPKGDEVAARLVELALGEPSGLVPDMGGPRVYGAGELLRGYLRATKRRRRPIVPLWLPGKAARVFRGGTNLAPEQAVGRRTWEEFLWDKVS